MIFSRLASRVAAFAVFSCVSVAHASVLGTFTDTHTGMTWEKVTDVQEGLGLGLRGATVAEFSSLISHLSGWQLRAGTTDEFTTSYGYIYSAWGTPLRTFLNAGKDTVYNVTTWQSQSLSETDTIGVSMGWLNGVTGGAVGATSELYASSTYGASLNGKGAVGSVADLAAGLHDSAPYSGLAGKTDWQADLALHAQSTGGYQLNYFYMVQAVPEASSSTMMLMGALVLPCAVAASRKKRPLSEPRL